MDTILVTGGIGTLGRHVVRRLNSGGNYVRLLPRHSRNDERGVHFATGDLLSGGGVDAAVAGVSTIIHCAGGGKGDDRATRNLVNAALRAGDPHLVYISVAGPRVYAASELIRAYLRAMGRHRLIVPITLPAAAARAIRAGANLAPTRAVGVKTWEDFLAERLSTTSARATAVESRRAHPSGGAALPH